MCATLFTPLQIGLMTLRNRTFMSPMSLGYESQDGSINEKLATYWLARAEGGVGCIILDALSVDPNVPYLGNTLCFRSEESIETYRAFTKKIHEAGAKVIPQITHPGPESISAFFGVPPVASSVYYNSMAQKTRELRVEELPGIISLYAKASLQAKEAGFDGIELHCAHAYMLLGSFLSPMRNKRCDAYGGCLENRARLLIEVLDAIKKACGKEFPIILRISGDEKNPQGNTVDDICRLVPLLIAHGVDAFEISGGTQYEAPNYIIPSHGEPEGINCAQAKRIKEVSSVPVIVVGKILDPHMAIQLVEEQVVDGVVLGRALLADEQFVKKAEQGRFDEIAPCTGCMLGCTGEQMKRLPGTCVINPFVGKESEIKITQASKKKRIAIVGGGPAGMVAARTLALRGHTPVLFEREEQLGGQLRLACVPPHKQLISKWVIYLRQELVRLQVETHVSTSFTKDLASGFDEIILATGAKEIIPAIPGVEKETAITAWQLLKQDAYIPGGNVLVVGGGMVGCEVSEHLFQQARGPLSISIIEMADEIAKGMVESDRQPMLKRLKQLSVNMMVNTKLEYLDEAGVHLNVRGTQVVRSDVTHVVYAVGSQSETSLYETLKELPNLHLVGDAKQPAQALEAIRDATLLALSL